ncbi:MAG: glycosyltransferase family 4 protein [Clostridiales bacterium]|nr:glycosyltransferase family 4 protein [Clostridiales bacterium]
MNIGIDARFILRPMRGMPLYVMRLCQLLPSVTEKHNFFYFINESFEHNSPRQEYLSRISELSKFKNVNIINCNDDAEILWEQFHLPRILKHYKINLLHMPGSRFSFTTTIPIVVTLHDLNEKSRLNFKSIKSSCSSLKPRQAQYFLRNQIYVWMQYKFGFKRAQKIITVSNYSASDIVKELNIDTNKVVAIHHGSETAFSNKPPIHFSKRRHVLVLGGEAYHKNLAGAIKSWSLIPKNLKERFPLKIVGLSKKTNPEILEMISDDEVKQYIKISGWITEDELVKYFQTAAVFLYLSYFEGFGFPLLHAMESGTPIVSSNVTSIPEVLNGVGLQCGPDDHAQIARNITQLLTNEELWEKQVASGQERVAKFSWQRSVLEHLDVYESIFNDQQLRKR